MKPLTPPSEGTLLFATAGVAVAGRVDAGRLDRRLDRHGARFDRRH